MERPNFNELSQQDRELLAKIEKIDREKSYFGWPEIAALADKLGNEYYKNFWKKVCSHYNHLEEGHNGDI